MGTVQVEPVSNPRGLHKHPKIWSAIVIGRGESKIALGKKKIALGILRTTGLTKDMYKGQSSMLFSIPFPHFEMIQLISFKEISGGSQRGLWF